MGMKYYAKSKKRGLSDKERGKPIKEPEEEQKTLNSHQEDIVRCAEARMLPQKQRMKAAERRSQ